MTDRHKSRGEQRHDERDPKLEREPQAEAQRNNARSTEQRGRDANRDGSDSDRDWFAPYRLRLFEG
jgi:hypothetical protein